MRWANFVGLPHEIGADPRHGRGADCLLTVFAVRDDLGLYTPPAELRWFSLARKSRWEELLQEFLASTYPTHRAPGRLRLFTQETGREFGLGVSVEGGMLLTRVRRGVTWLPNAGLARLGESFWYEPIFRG